jgi:predicted aspartyl protease
MITGFVNANREAVIRFSVRDLRSYAREIQAVIDTGFNGYLTLPDTVINAFGLSYHSRTIVTADLKMEACYF